MDAPGQDHVTGHALRADFRRERLVPGEQRGAQGVRQGHIGDGLHRRRGGDGQNPPPAGLAHGRNTARGHVDQTGDHVIEPFAPLRIRDLHRRRRRRPATIEHENIDAAHPRESVIDESVKVQRGHAGRNRYHAQWRRFPARGSKAASGAPERPQIMTCALSRARARAHAVAEAACRGEDECAFSVEAEIHELPFQLVGRQDGARRNSLASVKERKRASSRGVFTVWSGRNP